MKPFRVIAAIVVVVLLLVSIVISWLLPPPVDVARDFCLKKGFEAQKLTLLGYHGSNGLIGNRQTVEFQLAGANPPKRLVVDLDQLVYFLPWQLVSIREEAQP